MKKLALFFASILIVGCTSNNTELVTKISKLEEENQQLKETIKLLEYPASDRLINVNKLISENKIDEASEGINELQYLFPKSNEASEADNLKKIILDKQEKIREEQNRIKSLGFKVLNEYNLIQVDYNKISVGSFSIAQTFTFDYYDDSWRLFTADRGNKYISARITITSTNKEPLLPAFYAYSISGDKLILMDSFKLRFARWEDYATFLGNYNDNSNDFSKTGTISFKIGVEVSDEATKEPLVFLIKNENCMTRNYDRFENPPASYSNIGCSSSKTLSIEDVVNNYTVVKFYNKNKL